MHLRLRLVRMPMRLRPVRMPTKERAPCAVRPGALATSLQVKAEAIHPPIVRTWQGTSRTVDADMMHMRTCATPCSPSPAQGSGLTQ